ncbi:MAG: transcriptional regulator [Bacteroidales bacterium]|jgi:predicted AlkP superfamily phosphohydrolase/phosphomutase|nr:transcriptional regulator [Bacteroidales bacterium]
MTTGDKVLISPDLTSLNKWINGVIIEIENNTFNGIVVSAETKDGDVFFGRKDLFKTENTQTECLQ